MAKRKIQVYHGTSPPVTHQIIASMPAPKDGVCLNLNKGFKTISKKLDKLEKLGLKIFIDNGSFERFKAYKKKKISEADYFSDKNAIDYFKYITEQYQLLFQSSKHPENLIITIPEVIANAAMTQKLQKKYLPIYEKWQTKYGFKLIFAMQFDPRSPDWVSQMQGSAKALSKIVKPASEDGQRVGVPFGKDFAKVQNPKSFAYIDQVFKPGGSLEGRKAHLFAAGTPKKITTYSKPWVQSVDASSLNLWSRDAHYVMRTTGEVVDVRDMKGIPKAKQPWTDDQIIAAQGKIHDAEKKLRSEGIIAKKWYDNDITTPAQRFTINLQNFDAIVAGLKMNAAPISTKTHHVFAIEFFDKSGNVFSTSYKIYNRKAYTLKAAKKHAENWVKTANFSVPVRVRYIPSKKNETTKATPVSHRIATVLRGLRKTPIEEGLSYKRLEDELYLLLPPEKYGLESIQEILYEPSGKAARAKIIKQYGLSKNAFNFNAASVSLSRRFFRASQLLGYLKMIGITDGKAQLKRGIKIETEHTDDPSKARRIAMDHLTEFPTYYRLETGLPALEANLEKQNKSSPSSKKWMYFSLSPNGLIFSMDDVRNRLSQSGLSIVKYTEKLGEKNWIYEVSVKIKPNDPEKLKRVEKSIDHYITAHTEANGKKSIIVQASRSGDELLFIIEDGLAFLIDDYTEGPPEE